MQKMPQDVTTVDDCCALLILNLLSQVFSVRVGEIYRKGGMIFMFVALIRDRERDRNNPVTLTGFVIKV